MSSKQKITRSFLSCGIALAVLLILLQTTILVQNAGHSEDTASAHQLLLIPAPLPFYFRAGAAAPQ